MNLKTARSLQRAYLLKGKVHVENAENWRDHGALCVEAGFTCPSQTTPGKGYTGRVGFDGVFYLSECTCKAHWRHAEGTPAESIVSHDGVQTCKHTEAAALSLGWTPIN